ncbi:hypothetical protein [Deinococcus sp. JMULE3]|uniref:hypothetical protein n=1 Tax=Deinococcus sp. JMULE3 TaxID=2518341 RepID=UPI00157697A4|nr:hypothetical protein [Deinococcus sp. JMULE3]NTY00451.1 hypothetical protein [Deinococcus sp. JMULE3]
MTLTLTPPAALDAQIHAAVSTALTAPQAVVVVRMAPGQGKTTMTQQDVVQRLAVGSVHRVLWAARETVKGDSLGREALSNIQAEIARTGAPIQCDLVLGRDHVSPAEYEDALTWPEGPCIKIISHAHLPLLMETGLKTGDLATADLLVIDEDPSGQLIRSHAVPLTTLSAHSAPEDRVTRHLARYVDPDTVTAAGGELRGYQSFDGSRGGQAWFGETFWTDLGRLTEADRAAFLTTLAACPTAAPLRPGHLGAIRQALEEDEARQGPSGRFAVYFDTQATLKIHVRTPWTSPIPTVVLDAYAETDLYRPLFQERTVRLVEVGDPAAPLLIQQAGHVLARLDPTNFRRGRQPELLRRIFQEIQAHRAATPNPRETLLVAHKEIIEDARFDAEGRAVFGEDWGTCVRTQHWYAGRGKNEFEGYDLFALSQPLVSTQHRDLTLSALAPHRPEDREALHRLHDRSELLQTLHRNRQGRFPVSAAPLNVVFWDQVDAATYVPRLRHKRGSTNPLWRDRAHDVLQALLGRLGGVPKIALFVAGLESPDSRRTPQVPAAMRAGILQVLRDAGIDAPFTTPMSARGARKALEPILDALNLTSVDLTPTERVRGQSRAGFYVTPAPDPAAAARAAETALLSLGRSTLQAAETGTLADSEAARSGADSSSATSAAKVNDQHADSGVPS